MILRPATYDDCVSLAPRLRECDRTEIALGSGRDPLDVLLDGWTFGAHEEAIVTPSGSVAAIWGVMPLAKDTGAIWMLGSPEIEQVSLPFLRACRPAIERQHERFPRLACASWRGNALHHRWLRWLGFSATDVGHPHFLYFHRSHV